MPDRQLPEIIVYSRETCSPCKTVKWYLKQKGHEFTEKDIDEPDNFNDFVKVADMQMVPLIVIGEAKVQGLNLPALNRILDYYA